MDPRLAFLICSVGIAGLFYLDRDKSIRTSKALWLPVIWLWIAGSRTISAWLGIGNAASDNLAATLDGSPMDAVIFEILIVAAVCVLCFRGSRTIALLRSMSPPLIVYFLYCVMSTLWSPFPLPAFKRWTKDVGDLVMMLVIVTDFDPLSALRRLYSRLGFILFPLSVLLIRYTDMGRGYDPNGSPMNTGVTTNKNALGLIVFLVSLGVLWNIRSLILNKKAPNRTRRLIAQCTLLSFGLALLQMAHCATAVACFAIGGGLMLATGLRLIRKYPGLLHALCLGSVAIGVLAFLFGGASFVVGALGRDSTLSGRTDIWKAAIAAASDPLFGTGYESFWNANIDKVANGLPGYWGIHNLVSAHNGYIEVYLDLGWIGVCLIALILIDGYWRAVKAFQRNLEVGSLALTYIATCVFYCITEVGFRVLAPSWIFLLLAIASSCGVTAGLFRRAKSSEHAISKRPSSKSSLRASPAYHSGWPA
jgi:O-antigen ligase